MAAEPSTSASTLAQVADAIRWVVGVAAATAVVMLFTLEGGPRRPSAALDGQLARGAEIYAQRCATCHGAEGQGGQGPRLAGTVAILHPDPATEAAVIAAGRGAMPAFSPPLDADEIDAVVVFTRQGFG